MACTAARRLSLPRRAEHLDFDTYWKVTRGRSVILEDYKDEIATSKHKAARKTLVHRMHFFPYGERASLDEGRDAYVAASWLRLLKGLLDGSKAASLPLLKVGRAEGCSGRPAGWVQLHPAASCRSTAARLAPSTAPGTAAPQAAWSCGRRHGNGLPARAHGLLRG